MGLALQAFAMYALAYTTVEHGVGWLTWLVIIYRTSFGCVYTPLTTVILKTLPPDRLSMGSGLDGIHRGIGSAFGIAVGSMIVERHTASHLIALGEQHELQSLSVQEASNAVAEELAASGMAHGREEILAVLGDQLRQIAQMTAYQDTFMVLGGLTLLALPPAFLAHRRTARQERRAAEPAAVQR
jgi:hypothetical protein